MPIELVAGWTSANNGGAATITVTAPSLTVGHLVVVNISVRGGSGTTITPSAGSPAWNTIRRTDNTTTVSLLSLWRLVQAGEPESYSWDIGGSAKAAIGAMAFSGVNATPILIQSGQTTASATTHTTPTVNIPEQPSMVVAALTVATGTSFTDGSWTAGMTERIDVSSTGGSAGTRNTLAIANGIRSVTGNFSVSGVSGAAAVGCAHIIALKEAPFVASQSHRFFNFF